MHREILRRGKAFVRRVAWEAIVGASFLVAPDPMNTATFQKRVRKGWYGDREALRLDWEKVGADLYTALNRFKSGHRP